MNVRLKTFFFAIVVILTSVGGNFSLSWGMHQVGSLASVAPLAYVRAVFNPWVTLGISLLVLWLFSHMTLLSWADLSYVLPVTSVGYVLSALAGKLFLHEEISPARWAGILLIVSGVALVARTSPQRAMARSGASL
ncbi:MAG: EamA family transporter [Bryobacteraceae bacterium]